MIRLQECIDECTRELSRLRALCPAQCVALHGRSRRVLLWHPRLALRVHGLQALPVAQELLVHALPQVSNQGVSGALSFALSRSW